MGDRVQTDGMTENACGEQRPSFLSGEEDKVLLLLQAWHEESFKHDAKLMFQKRAALLAESKINRDMLIENFLRDIRGYVFMTRYSALYSVKIPFFKYAVDKVSAALKEPKPRQFGGDAVICDTIWDITCNVTSYILFTPYDMHDLIEYVIGLRRILQNQALTLSDKVNLLSLFHTQTVDEITPPSKLGKDYNVYIFNRGDPERYLRTRILYLLNLEGAELENMPNEMHGDVELVKQYLYCYPEEYPKIHDLFSVSVSACVDVRYGKNGEKLGTTVCATMARAMFNSLDKERDMSAAKEKMVHVKAIRDYVRNERWYDALDKLKIPSSDLAPKLHKHASRLFSGFWTIVQDDYGCIRYMHMDVLEYFRAVTLNILHENDIGLNECICEIRTYMRLCNRIRSWSSVVYLNPGTDAQLYDFLAGFQQNFRDKGPELQLYALWCFCLDVEMYVRH